MAPLTESTHLLRTTVESNTDCVVPDDGGNADKRWDGLADFTGLPWWQRPSMTWLLVPYSIYTLAFGSVIVPKLNLILDLVCQYHFAKQDRLHPNNRVSSTTLETDKSRCRNPEIQKSVATLLIVLHLFTGLLSAYAAPRLGHLSDRYGRRRFLALSACGGLLDECITILVTTFPQMLNYRWLILGSMLDGILGSFTAANILTQLYAIDCTPPPRRTVAIGYIHACLFTGLAAGQLLGGEIVRLTGSLVSIFYVNLVARTVFVGLVAVILPDSLSAQTQHAARESHHKKDGLRPAQRMSFSPMLDKNPFSSLCVLWPKEQGTSRRLRCNLVAMAACDMIMMGSVMAAGQVLILYAGYILDWDTPETSRFVSAASSFRVMVLLGILPLITYLFRNRTGVPGTVPARNSTGANRLDIWILRVALMASITGFLGYSFASSSQAFVACSLITAFSALGSATSQSVVTKLVPHGRVGQVLGAIGMLQALVRVFAPMAFNSIYAATVHSCPQAIFYALAGLFTIAFLCSFMITPFVHWQMAPLEQDREPLNSAIQ